MSAKVAEKGKPKLNAKPPKAVTLAVNDDVDMTGAPAIKDPRFELESKYKLDKRPLTAASLFSSVQKGESEIWLIQLPRQMPVQSLKGLEVQLHEAGPSETSGHLLGAFKDTAGLGHVMTQDVSVLAHQMSVQVAQPIGGTKRLPIARRITISQDLRKAQAGPATADPGHAALLLPNQLYSDILFLTGQPQGPPLKAAAAAVVASVAAPVMGDKAGEKKKKKKKAAEEEAAATAAAAAAEAVPEPVAGPGPSSERKSSKKRAKAELAEAEAAEALQAQAVVQAAAAAAVGAGAGSSKKHKHKRREEGQAAGAD